MLERPCRCKQPLRVNQPAMLLGYNSNTVETGRRRPRPRSDVAAH